MPFAEAVAVRGEHIIFVGTADEAREFRGTTTKVIECNGCTLMPGFIDCHYHLLSGSLTLNDIHLENAISYEEVSTNLKKYAAEHPEKYWLTGHGLRYNLGPGCIPLHRRHIDAIVSERPVFIHAYDYHTSWANTKALQEAGLLYGKDVGPNSEIVLDEKGEATGELREAAGDLIEVLLPTPSRAEKLDMLRKGMQLAAQYGITSIHNMDGDEEQAVLYASLEEAGEMSVRIYLPYSIRTTTSIEDIETKATLLQSKYRSPLLRGGSVKIFMDGVIEAYTGLLVEEYADSPGRYGGSNYTQEQFSHLVCTADRLGLQVCAHSVGDLGVRRVLDAYQTARQVNGIRDSRHRIEHIELIQPDDVQRFAKLGVIASMQPLHAPLSSDGNDVWLQRVGAKRWPLSFAWQILRQAEAIIVFGSDWPVVSQNPILGIHTALNRLPWKSGILDQRQSLNDALLSYTRLAAFAEFQEQIKGQLKEGYLADIVLLSEDIFNFPTEYIKNIRPLLTMVGGKIVYENSI